MTWGGNSKYAPRVRTQQDKVNDCHLFIANARADILMATTADKLCDDKGVVNRDLRRAVEARLLAAQDKERRRA